MSASWEFNQFSARDDARGVSGHGKRPVEIVGCANKECRNVDPLERILPRRSLSLAFVEYPQPACTDWQDHPDRFIEPRPVLRPQRGNQRRWNGDETMHDRLGSRPDRDLVAGPAPPSIRTGVICDDRLAKYQSRRSGSNSL